VTAPQLHHGDCLDVLATFEPASFGAFVDDPPAGIAFMGRAWDDLRGYKPRTHAEYVWDHASRRRKRSPRRCV
jgi:DNA modification methylase